MKKSLLVLIISSLSLSAFGDEHYKCYNLKNAHQNEEVSMTIITGLFSKKITSVELLSKIKANRFEVVSNPFTNLGLSASGLDQVAIAQASKLNFKMIEKKDPETSKSIALSESLINLQDQGYAHYHVKTCFWILDCTESYEYFKCDKI